MIRLLIPVMLVFAASVWQEPTSAVKKPAPLKEAPISFYKDHCQRCHGPNGMFYIPGFAAKRQKDGLKAELLSMAHGAGQTAISDDQLIMQVDLHIAFSEEKPYLNWTKREGDEISGEKTKGSLTAAFDGKPIDVDLDGFVWTIKLPAGSDLNRLSLTLKDGKKIAILKPGTANWVIGKNPPLQ